MGGVVTNGETLSLGTGEAVRREGCLLIAADGAGPGGGATRVTHSSRRTHLFWGPAGPNERPDELGEQT